MMESKKAPNGVTAFMLRATIPSTMSHKPGDDEQNTGQAEVAGGENEGGDDAHQEPEERQMVRVDVENARAP